MSDLRWGLWRMPDKPEPGELRWVRNSATLPCSWRGFIREYASYKEASDAWSAGHFIRPIDEDEAARVAAEDRAATVRLYGEAKVEALEREANRG